MADDPTGDEIRLTLELYNSLHRPDQLVLREHWDSWWGEPIPRATMGRYLNAARRMIRLAKSLGLVSA